MPDDRLLPWEVVESREVYAAPPWVTVSVQKVRLPDGRVVPDFHQLGLPEYTVVFAQTPEDRVVVMRQFRQGVGRVSLLLPAGHVEKGEEPLACAQRELLEESGFTATDWQSLGSFVPNANYGGGRAHLFKCRNARKVAEPDSDDLEATEILLLSPEELREAHRRGDIAVLGIAATIALALGSW
ncbi:MAG: NUDIX hydrolase [Opitutales bacterium]|jgi:ADP-ribose pyrophosphatase